ncbi:MAG: PAS domain S-box protein [Candidatus Eremiobacteraeota bacterium]|nr:PAS domain S-box protein [Candidatus Eremiobacteraeota bacterium]
MKKKIRILILEDVPADYDLLVHEVRKAGIVFISKRVETREDFLRELDEFAPDIILSDYKLPGFDGMSALRLKNEHAPSTPFIIVTGSINEEVAVECIKAGSDDYELKENLIRLFPAIKKALENKQIKDNKERAETALQESEGRFRAMMEQSPIAVQMMTPDGRIVQVNDAYLKLWGFTPQVMQQVYSEYNILQDEQVRSLGLMPYIERAFAGEAVSLPPFEYDALETMKTEGGKRWIQSFIYPVKDKNGKIQNLFMMHEDITERKKHLETMKRYRFLLESLTDGVLIIDQEWRYLSLNDEVARMVQMPKEKLIGNKMTDLFPGIEHTVFGKTYSQVLETGEPATASDEFTFSDGRRGWYEVQVFPATEGLLIIVADITERKRAQDTLFAEKERLEVTLRSIGDCAIVTDNNGKIELVNKVAEELTGWTQQEAIGKPLNEVFCIINEKTGRPCENPVEKTISSGRIIGLANDTVLIAKDGTEKIIADSAAPIRDKDGNVIGVILVFHDITEKKKAEKALQKAHDELEIRVLERTANLSNANKLLQEEIAERNQVEQALRDSEERFRNFVENSNDIIYTLNKNGVFLYVSSGWTRILGHDIKDVVGKPLAPFIHPDDVPVCFAFLKKVIDTGEPQGGVEYRIKHLDGTLRWHASNASCIKDEDGNVLYFLGISRDITEQKRVEQALRESEKRFRDLSESTSDWIWEVNENAQYTYTSPVIKNLLGYEPEEVIGKTPFDLMSKEEGQRVGKIFAGIVEKREPFFHLENNNLHKDGRSVYLETSGVPIFDEAGSFRGYRGIDRDITQRKETEEELDKYRANLEEKVEERTKQLENAIELLHEEIDNHKKSEEELKRKMAELLKTQNELEAVNKELDSFTYTASHDLKEPLRGIVAFCGFLMEDYQDKLDDTGKNYLKRITASTVRSINLIDDLLILSRISRIRNPYISADSGRIVKNAIRRLDPILEERKVRIIIDDELPYISCDLIKLTEVFYNFISNSIKYNDKPNPVIEIGFMQSEAKEPETTFFVKDNGIGINKEYFDKIFKIFRRLHTRTEYGGGTGAGLAIVKKIIHEHGGKIWVESEEGKGTTFYFTIPQ